MLSVEELREKLKHISELSGDNEEIMNSLAEIQSGIEERLTNAETPANAYTDSDVMASDGVRWSVKYDDMVRKYRDRFFGGIEEVKKENDKDIKKDTDAESVTFADLFSDRAGDYK